MAKLIKRIKTATFAALKPKDKEQRIPDGGGLYYCIRAIKDGGSTAFRYQYHIAGNQHRITLTSSTLAKARLERDGYAEQVKQGKDPRHERTLLKERNIALQQQARKELEGKLTVNALFTRWHTQAINHRKDATEIERMFKKDILPRIGEYPVKDVKKADIVAVVDAITSRKVGRMAKMLLGLTRQMFQFAIEKDIIEFNPTANISKAKIGGKDVERDRVLNDDEIRALVKQLPNANLLKSTECAIWIALSTLCRIGELSKARVDDVDWDNGIWAIPASNSKNGKAHTIYLSEFALRHFKELKSLAGTDAWFFANRSNTGFVCDKSITVQIVGRQAKRVLKNRTKHSQALVLKGGRWTSHDLRRTGATLMGDLGIASNVIEKCLNHTEADKIKRIYQRQALINEQKEAWMRLGEHLTALVG